MTFVIDQIFELFQCTLSFCCLLFDFAYNTFYLRCHKLIHIYKYILLYLGHSISWLNHSFIFIITFCFYANRYSGNCHFHCYCSSGLCCNLSPCMFKLVFCLCQHFRHVQHVPNSPIIMSFLLLFIYYSCSVDSPIKVPHALFYCLLNHLNPPSFPLL